MSRHTLNNDPHRENGTEPPRWESSESIHGPRVVETEYELAVDPSQNDRATEINLLSARRPHMRALHCAWVSFFTAFFLWFSISPLLGEIGISLKLSRDQLWISIICSDLSTLVARFVVGPMCDIYGPRIPMAVVLCLVSIPTALTGLINSMAGLCALRFFIGIAGSSFVMAQYWTGRMFARELIGTANSLVAGWGNLGGGFAQIIMGSALFPLFKEFTDGDADRAWRWIFVFPAAAAMLVGLTITKVSDDAPQGVYKEMKKRGQMDIKRASFFKGAAVGNACLLAILYACTFGVEISMNNALSMYFRDEFGQSTESAAAISSIFGGTNLFARACGGLISDRLNKSIGMRGRLWLQTILIFLQGTATIAFAVSDRLSVAIPMLIIMSILVNASEGAIFGVVPYVNTAITGSIAGIVGCGGNIGGVFFGFCFYQLSFRTSFIVMGATAMVSTFLNFVVVIPGYSSMMRSTANAFAENTTIDHAQRPAVEIPNADEEATSAI